MTSVGSVAVIGTGVLGEAIAERLRTAGQTVLAYNRTESKTLPLQALGITVVAKPEQAIARVDCVLLVLADAAAIRSVLFAPATRAALQEKKVIQMGTIGVEESIALQTDLTSLGARYCEAPVLGSRAEAKAGTLLVMVGGSVAQFQEHLPLLKLLSREPCHVGTVGKAAALKLALNQLIASETAAFALSLGLVQRSGLSPDTFMAVLRESALFAPTFEKKLPRLLTRDYGNPNFTTNHLHKDLAFFLKEGAALGLTVAAAQVVDSLLRRAIEDGFANQDYSAIFEMVNPPGGTA